MFVLSVIFNAQYHFSGMFTTEVQFGHAGASANAEKETSVYKNSALQAAGARVPDSFDGLADVIKATFSDLVAAGVVKIEKETAPPTVPMDFNWARVSNTGYFFAPFAEFYI